MRYYLAVYLMLILAAAAHAGEIDGIICDSGQELEGASIIFKNQTAVTDAEGRFVLKNVPAGDNLLHILHPDGKRIKHISAFVLSDARTSFTFDFSGEILPLGEVTVYGEPVVEATPGKQTMQVSEILRVTGAANDPLRALQILPGVTSPNSFMTGLNIRGGGQSDNSYYFDRVSLSYPYHFGGLSTTINSAAIESIDVHAGGFGAEFGDAQAVIDIHAKPPDREKVSFTSDLNMIMSEAMLESPLGSKGAFYIAGRRSYADLIIPHIIDIPELTQFPMYWDYQAGFDYDLTPDQQLHFTAFSARDLIAITITEDFGSEDGEGDADIDPEFLGESHYIGGFDAQLLALNSSFGENFKLKSTLSRVRDVIDLQIGEGSYYLRLKPSFYTIREDAEYDIHPRHKLQMGGVLGTGIFGLESLFPRVPDEEEIAEDDDYEGPFGDDQVNIESDISDRFTFTAGYLQDRIALADWLHIKLGARLGYFNVMDDVTVDPRASMSIKMPNDTIIRAAWGIYHQNPTPDQFLPDWGNPEIHASKVTHYVLELEKDNFYKDASIKLAGYYKDMKDLVTTHPTDLYRNQGTGYAQGMEMMLKYNPSPRFLGWLSYTYSLSRRKDNPDEPERLYIYDQTHVATLNISSRPTPNWEVGLRWNYATGAPMAPSDEKLSAVRDPSTHRMDLRFARTFHIRQRPVQVYLDILNAYDHSSSISTETEAEDLVEYETEEVTMPVVPYIGISMKF